MRHAALIVAAGRGARAGGPEPKQWRQIAGKSVARWTLEAFSHLDARVLVIHPADRVKAEAAAEGLDVRIVAGGPDRAASVRNGLEALVAVGLDTVLIHDVARPCVPRAVIDGVLSALDTGPGAAPALPVTDALWRVTDGTVAGTVNRQGLFRAQTPQGFHFRAILDAHMTHPGGAADDVEVARHAGLSVIVTDGCEDNLKITAPEDFARAERILERVHGHQAGERV
ncbi:2-C-methyl-D-erythritol 4-phosphate cytidylyltransferase [Roseivivax halodurans JCM 10272]|uniref:2-C-methyl-D-erythritol 4-phosphate cytidylyltransferase n=1 Tax=Roseivivax halodurans JCM 10272 TaxID=1449350 RepID=X7EAF9_9RHOB|nr:2-C-methyl-D-erythritol 4-phosphate cytidylyltransferase [Roseivivax halodurans]ETX13074.1 2-C-methyl-D-erythritol 4-phosphate cytidylyltransferase [Roseivivax halodurans JCM 10272]